MTSLIGCVILYSNKVTMSINNKKTTELFQAILTLGNIQEAKMFFADLLTGQEIDEFGNRWYSARMLADGISYVEIEKETGLSSTTIARISKCLKKGKRGYKTIIKKLSIF